MVSLKEVYLLTNKILLFFCLFILAYIFVVNLFDLSVACQYNAIYGTTCRSCGLTRGVFNCLKFDFITALRFNNQSLFIFCGLISQILIRIVILNCIPFLINGIGLNYKSIIFIDLFTIITMFLFDVFYFL
jgi:hypothetical protein